MCSVWKAPATESGRSRAFAGERGELLQGAGGHDLPGAVDVGGGEPVLVDGGEYLVGVTAQHRGHPGLGDGGGPSHGAPALAHQHHGGFRGHHPGDGGGGQLAHAVPGDHVGGGVQCLRGGQRGGYQEWLCDRGVTDLVGVRGGAIVHQVQSCDRRPPGEAVGDGGQLEPRLEESGRLGALAGRCDENHAVHLALWRTYTSMPVATKFRHPAL
jgi:hypothetical protein